MGAFIATLFVAGCKADSDQLFANDGDEAGDDGLFVLVSDLPPESELPTGSCIQNPMDGIYGYWHQCFGELGISFEATFNGNQYTGADYLAFGPGRENPDYWSSPDSYDNPLVAACCGPFDYANPTSDEKVPYVNNCLFDAVQQICIGFPKFLRKQATKTPAGDGKLVLEWLADQIESDINGCVWSLWAQPPGPEGLEWYEIAGTTWSPVDAVQIKLDQAIVYDWTEVGDVDALTICHGVFDNDTAINPTANSSEPGSKSTLRMGSAAQATVVGPQLISAMQISSDKSYMSAVLQTDDAAIISGLVFTGEPADVYWSDQTLHLHHAITSLTSAVEFQAVDGGYILDAGDAVFDVMVAGNGKSRNFKATNESRVFLQHDPMGWRLASFTLEYEDDLNFYWSIVIDEVVFVDR